MGVRVGGGCGGGWCVVWVGRVLGGVWGGGGGGGGGGTTAKTPI